MTPTPSKKGKGLVNSAIDKLPFEVHLPGYQYCGPGTNLMKRLARDDPGINGLDRACKEHDIAYYWNKNNDAKLTEADQKLASKAWDRVISSDAGLHERSNALAVATAMKAKVGISKLGAGMDVKRKTKKSKKKRKKSNSKSEGCCTFQALVKKTANSMKKAQPASQVKLMTTAIAAAKRIKQSSGKISQPRVIPVPKTGGVLPIIPIFAGLSALGSLIGGGAAVGRAVSATSEAKKALDESQRHNQHMEAIAIGKSKSGSGLYLKPYKSGYGIYLKPYPQSKNY